MNLDLLKKYSKMNSSEEIQLFEKGIWKFAETKNKNTLIQLLNLFDDKCKFQEVMYSLVHAVETYPMDFYIKILIQEISRMLKTTPMWLDILINRIFNSPEGFPIFRSHLHLTSKDSLLKLFDIMDQESPHHRELIAELRAEVLKRKD